MGKALIAWEKLEDGPFSMVWIFFEAQQIDFSFRLEGRYQSIKRIAFYPSKTKVIFDRNLN